MRPFPDGDRTVGASQAALAQNSAYQRDMGALRTAQADAMTEADRGIAELERQYQANVSSAIADNDYQRAQALLNEYNNGYTRDLNTAKTLAAYGDFSGYAGLYGQDTANNMAALWKAQNPDLAYNTGRMSAEEYKAVTGKYPKGYTAPRSGGAAVRDPYGLNSLSDAQRSTQIRGLLESLNKGDASARAKALNYISANEAYFTDNELNNFTSALEKGMRLAGYNL